MQGDAKIGVVCTHFFRKVCQVFREEPRCCALQCVNLHPVTQKKPELRFKTIHSYSSASVLRWSPTNAQPSHTCFFASQFLTAEIIFVFSLELSSKNKTEILFCETKKKCVYSILLSRPENFSSFFVHKVSAFLDENSPKRFFIG